MEEGHRGRNIAARMIGAARLDSHVYEDVEADPNATWQAVLVVLLVAVATGVGALNIYGGGVRSLILGIISGLAQWALWAFITYFVGTTSFFREPQTHASWGQLARTLGFAQSPSILRVLGIIPLVGPVIFVLTFFWQLAAMVIAVRQALDYHSTWRAVGVVVIGFIGIVIIQAAVAALSRL